MDESDKAKIRDNFCFLHDYVQGMQESLFPSLLEQRIFTQAMIDTILAEKTSSLQSRKFLQLLSTRGPQAWTSFLKSIMKLGDHYVVEKVDSSFAKTLNVREQSVKHLNSSELPPHESSFYGSNTDINVIVKRGEKIVINDHIYPNNSNPRGLAIIINNIEFIKEEKRSGSEIDSLRLKNLFEGIGYSVEECINLKANEIMNMLKVFSEDERHKQLCSCIIVLLSHGERDFIYGSDSEKVKLDNIYKIFDNYNCYFLMNKPKLFIIQACRGNLEDLGEVSDSWPMPPRVFQFQSGDRLIESKIPIRSDMILAYATLNDYVALRHQTHGSRFIQILVDVFKENAWSTHVTDLLTMVNSQMKNIQVGNRSQQSEFTSNLTKQFFLFPGL